MDFFLSKPIRRPALKHVLKTYCPTIPEEDDTTPPGTATKANGVPTAAPTKAVAQVTSTAPFTTVAGTSDRRHADDSPAISPMSSPVS
jgi:osomolarity two-component system sensor histidine kinase SLN1